MLLSLDKYSQALDKAVKSGNTDLINIVIVKMLHLKKSLKMSREDFQLEIRKNVTVYALYKKYCEEFDKEALLNIYRQEEDDNEVAACHLKNAYDPEVCFSRIRFSMFFAHAYVDTMLTFFLIYLPVTSFCSQRSKGSCGAIIVVIWMLWKQR